MSLKKIIGEIYKADHDYHLIDDNDVIAVGISGGKDSVLLALALHYYKNMALHYDNKHFDIVAIHLEMDFPDMDFSEIRKFMALHGIQYIDYPTEIHDILYLHPDNQGRIQCSLCSRLKKGAIINAAKKYHCNKIAFAHHADDAIETLFMNMIQGGRITTFAPAMYLKKAQLGFIRPLVYTYEKYIISTAAEEQIPVVKSTCPNDGFTLRQDIKDVLAGIYHDFPGSHKNFLTALSNTEQLKLFYKNSDWRNE